MENMLKEKYKILDIKVKMKRSLQSILLLYSEVFPRETTYSTRKKLIFSININRIYQKGVRIGASYCITLKDYKK